MAHQILSDRRLLSEIGGDQEAISAFLGTPPFLPAFCVYNGWTRDCRHGRMLALYKGLIFVKETRSSNRHTVNLDVNVSYQGASSDQTMVNMSLGGALITFAERLPLGSSVDLVFRIPTLESSISTKAIVRWATEESTGVQFDGLRAREVWSLTEYFKQFE